MMIPTTRLTRTPVVLAALVALLSSVFLVVAPRAAAEVTPEPVAEPGSVTVVAEHNTSAKVVPVSGVSFTLQQVLGLDLSTDEGLAQAAALIEDPALADDLGQALTMPLTDAEGVTFAGDLSQGLYLLRHVNADQVGWGYQDMVFSLPGTGEVDGQVVESLELTLHPKPAPVEEPKPEEPTPDVKPDAPKPDGPKVDAGDGALFSSLPMWLSIIGGLVLLALTLLATTRRRGARS